MALVSNAARLNRKLWLVLAGLVALTIAVLAFRYRGHLSSAFGSLAEATGGKAVAVLCLVGGVFVVVCSFFWMILPILVYLGLKDIRRRTAQLERTTEVCVQHLAFLTDHERIVKADPQAEQKTARRGQP